MSAHMKLSAADLRDLGAFLDSLSEATAATGINACYYDSVSVGKPEWNAPLRVNYDTESKTYIVDESVGS